MQLFWNNDISNPCLNSKNYLKDIFGEKIDFIMHMVTEICSTHIYIHMYMYVWIYVFTYTSCQCHNCKVSLNITKDNWIKKKKKNDNGRTFTTIMKLIAKIPVFFCITTGRGRENRESVVPCNDVLWFSVAPLFLSHSLWLSIVAYVWAFVPFAWGRLSVVVVVGGWMVYCLPHVFFLSGHFPRHFIANSWQFSSLPSRRSLFGVLNIVCDFFFLCSIFFNDCLISYGGNYWNFFIQGWWKIFK